MTSGPVSLVDALRERVESLQADAHQLVMKAYEAEAIRVLEKIIRLLDGRPEPEFQEFLAEAMLDKGRQLSSLERDGDAIGIFDAVIERFKDRNEPAFRLAVAEALSAKGFCHYILGEFQSEIAAYDEIILRNASETASRWLMRQVSWAACSKVVSLDERGETALALTATEEWLQILAQPDFYPVAYERADAGFRKGVFLGQLEREAEAITAYDEVIREFDSAESASLRLTAAKCFFNKAWSYCDLGDPDKEMDTYRELISRYVTDADDEMKAEVAMTYVNLGICLERKDQNAEAIELL